MPRFRLTAQLPQEIVDHHGRTWVIDFRVQECSDRHLVALRRVDQAGEWWVHVFPCWESLESRRLLYETGIEPADGLPQRVFAQLSAQGKAEAVSV